MNKLIIHTDGGARGNPGPAAIGAILATEDGEIVAEISRVIGRATNNQAEYQAVVAALDKASALKAQELHFYLDSELVVKQLNREYKVKNKELIPLFVSVYNKTLQFKKVKFTHIPREQNKAADALVNQALDKKIMGN